MRRLLLLSAALALLCASALAWDHDAPVEEQLALVQDLVKAYIKADKVSRPALRVNPPEHARKRAQPSTGLFDLPIGGYIRWGRTHCNSTNNPQNYYTNLNNQAYLTIVHYINNVLGGILLNGTRYVIEDINFNDGADCSLMQLLYQHMVEDLGAQFLFAPTNPDCSVLAKYAESKGVLFGNGADYSLLILEAANGTTSYDETAPYARDISYADLQWTYNMMQDPTNAYLSCSQGLTDPRAIDQSGLGPNDPPRRVRTMVAGSNELEVPNTAAGFIATLASFNVSLVYPRQNWDLSAMLNQGCSYFGTTLEDWKALDADLVLTITGASNTTFGINCMHRELYAPRNILVPIPVVDPSFPSWEKQGLITSTPFFVSDDFVDPIFGHYSVWSATYAGLFGYPPTFFETTIVATAIVLVDCINTTQSLDSLVIRECIRNYNRTTIYGDVSFNPDRWFVDRPYVCTQRQENDTDFAAYPLDYPNRRNFIMPDRAVFPDGYQESLKGHGGLAPKWITLSVVLPALFVAALVGGIAFIIHKKYHLVFVAKGAKEADHW